MNAYVMPGVKDLGDLPPKRDFVPQKIITTVSEYLDVPYEIITRKGRKRETVYARKLCVYLIIRYSEYTLDEVGSFFNDALLDHTSVRHSRDYIYTQITGKYKNQEIINDLKYITHKLENDETVRKRMTRKTKKLISNN
jgi:chromosomal replication initiation ATPase DnaA